MEKISAPLFLHMQKSMSSGVSQVQLPRVKQYKACGCRCARILNRRVHSRGRCESSDSSKIAEAAYGDVEFTRTEWRRLAMTSSENCTNTFCLWFPDYEWETRCTHQHIAECSSGMRLFSQRGQTAEEGIKPKKTAAKTSEESVRETESGKMLKQSGVKNARIRKLFIVATFWTIVLLVCCSLVWLKRKTLFYLCDEKLESEVINLLRIALNAFQQDEKENRCRTLRNQTQN